MTDPSRSTNTVVEPWETIAAYGPVDDFDLHPILRRAYRVAVLIERAPHASIEQTAASSAAFDLVKEISDTVLVLKGEAMLVRAKADAYDRLISKDTHSDLANRLEATMGRTTCPHWADAQTRYECERGTCKCGEERMELTERAIAALRRLSVEPSVWQPIDTIPVTATEADLWDCFHCLLYGPRMGVQSARVHRFTGQAPTGSVGHLSGDAVGDWGATHWMPKPLPPEFPETKEAVPNEACACAEYWPGQPHHPECPTLRQPQNGGGK